VIAVSRFLAAKGIVENPTRRLGLQLKLLHGAPEVILMNVPGEWARLKEYWHDIDTFSQLPASALLSNSLGWPLVAGDTP